MSIYITTDALWWSRCPMCKGEPSHLEGGQCDECSCTGEVADDLGWLATLAHNLAIAAGLCRAFELAVESCFTYCDHWYGADGWKPGCGRGAP